MRNRTTFYTSALIILGALFTIGSAPISAAVPDSISFSGALSSGGSPVPNGPHAATFTIYDQPVGGSVLWTETQSVTTSSGLFNTILGSVLALPNTLFSGPNRFLGITVSPDPEMTPRVVLVTVPYSFRVASVDGATGGSIIGTVTLFGGDLRVFDGDLTVPSGNLYLDWTNLTGIIFKGGLPFIHESGGFSTFIGHEAGNLSTSGTFNTGCGQLALSDITSGTSNTANGFSALTINTTGNGNTADGVSALGNNTTGSNNTAIGNGADVASGALTNATAIGTGAVVTASNNMKFGNSSVVGWGFGATPAAGHCLQVGTGVTNGNGAFLSTGGAWTNGSDRNTKEGITLVDGSELLQKVNRLPVYRWNYKGEDPSHRHVGPMAQDFRAVFGLGDDDKHISTIDPSGIALAAIQALYEQQKSENQHLQAQIAELRELINQKASERK